MHELTEAQHASLEYMYVYHRVGKYMDLETFKRQAQPVVFGDGAVAVKIPETGMFVCVEADGHRHT